MAVQEEVEVVLGEAARAVVAAAEVEEEGPYSSEDMVVMEDMEAALGLGGVVSIIHFSCILDVLTYLIMSSPPDSCRGHRGYTTASISVSQNCESSIYYVAQKITVRFKSRCATQRLDIYSTGILQRQRSSRF